MSWIGTRIPRLTSRITCSYCLARTNLVPSSLPRRERTNRSYTTRSSTSSTSSTSSSPSPSPSPSSSPSPSTRTTTPLQKAQTRLQTLLNSLDDLARQRSSSLKLRIDSWQLETKLRRMGRKINTATGYEEIDSLRKGVIEREKALNSSREVANLSKQAFSAAVAVRAASQKEVNDLLQRKSSWNSQDVIRFTDLIQQDHLNEKAEVEARLKAEQTEQEVEKGFSDLMQAILERYHEEQVWSDKIRSLSTYGSLGITTLNVVLFIVTILLVEPWKRRRLVEGVEARLRENTNQGQEATMTSLVALQSLLTDAQTKLDRLLTTNTEGPPQTTAELSAPVIEVSTSTSTEHESTTLDAVETEPKDASFRAKLKPYLSEIGEQDWKLVTMGGVGVGFGICLSAALNLLLK